MKTPTYLALLAASVLSASALAAAPTDYQVTGPILELTDTTITVQKGKEKWELARGADTKVTGELKVGAKVTIHYTMTAKSAEVKEEKAGAKSAAKSGDKPAANAAGKPAAK